MTSFFNNITASGYRATKDDDYVCFSVKAPEPINYIVRFTPVADSSVVHHLILFGCEGNPQPSGPRPDCMWPCASQSPYSVLYAWAQNAPSLALPAGVGARTGADEMKYYTLQLHYRQAFPDGKGFDHSGVVLTSTHERPQRLSSVLLVSGTNRNTASSKQEVYFDGICRYQGTSVLHPFAFRVHSHSHGVVITGYHVNSSWHLIGKGNPQWPQAFYPTEKDIYIEQGDMIVVRCTYNATDNKNTINMGRHSDDEMCNFYIMLDTEWQQDKLDITCHQSTLQGIIAQMPSNASVPLPRNPVLEDVARPHAMFDNNQLPGTEKLDVVTDWPKITSSDNLTLGQISAVAVDKRGNVHIFHRGPRQWDAASFDRYAHFQHISEGAIAANTLVEFDADVGNVISQWGNNIFYMPHGLFIDKDDNFWITDTALHQVMKFKRYSSQPELVLGQQFIAGNDTNLFCQPADVVVFSSGDIYIADGYCNRRVIQFDGEGRFVRQWSTPGDKASALTPALEFYIPHSLTTVGDTELCLADRENGRVACFKRTGDCTHLITPQLNAARIFAISYDQLQGLLFAVVLTDRNAMGLTISLSSNKVLSTWNPRSGVFNTPHDITVSPDGLFLYIVQLSQGKIFKLIKPNTVIGSNVSHQSVKKGGVMSAPQSLDGGADSDIDDKLLDEVEQENRLAMIVIIVLLFALPAVMIVTAVVFTWIQKKGRRSPPFCTTFTDRSRSYHKLRHVSGIGVDHDELHHLNSDDDDYDDYITASRHST